MTRSYTPEDLEKLSAAERKFIESIESEPKRREVACSLIQHRLPDRLKVGDALPDLSLRMIHSDEVHPLRSCVGDRPLLLAFGSYT
jgi:hypothetical protein